MKLPKIYFDTSVPSSFYDTDNPNLTALTRLFWQDFLPRYDGYISEATIQEIKKTAQLQKRNSILQLIKNCTILRISTDVEKLAADYHQQGIVPKSFPIDALHLACATFYKVDFVATWNISHMANPNKRKKLTDFNMAQGLFVPQITTPEELIQIHDSKNK